VANDHAKGNAKAYPSSCHAALTLINNFKQPRVKHLARSRSKKVAGTPATECNYNREYFAGKECHNCSKKGHPARCCTNKKGKGKKDSEDNKSVLSSKSINTLTKQIKTLKMPVSTIQAHQEDSDDNSSLSSEDGDEHFQYACAAIEATNPKVAMALKSHKARDLDLRSVWLLDNQSTFDLCCNLDFSRKRCNAKWAMNILSNRGGL
jgi:hypothetical protein